MLQADYYFKRTGVRIICVCPGGTLTRFLEDFPKKMIYPDEDAAIRFFNDYPKQTYVPIATVYVFVFKPAYLHTAVSRVWANTSSTQRPMRRMDQCGLVTTILWSRLCSSGIGVRNSAKQYVVHFINIIILSYYSFNLCILFTLIKHAYIDSMMSICQIYNCATKSALVDRLKSLPLPPNTATNLCKIYLVV